MAGCVWDRLPCIWSVFARDMMDAACELLRLSRRYTHCHYPPLIGMQLVAANRGLSGLQSDFAICHFTTETPVICGRTLHFYCTALPYNPDLDLRDDTFSFYIHWAPSLSILPRLCWLLSWSDAVSARAAQTSSQFIGFIAAAAGGCSQLRAKRG